MKTILSRTYEVETEKGEIVTIRDNYEIPENGTEMWCTSWPRGQLIRPLGDGKSIVVGLSVLDGEEYMDIINKEIESGEKWGIEVKPVRLQMMNGNWYQINPEMSYMKELPFVSQAASLPDGWQWTDHSDGSGGLHSPDGDNHFGYDLTTREFQTPGISNNCHVLIEHYFSFPDGFSLSKLKAYAEERILDNELNHNYYYSFGSSKHFPFQNGYIRIIAPSFKDSVIFFRALYPDRNEGVLNCADFYTEEQFDKTAMKVEGNLGAYCHKVFTKASVMKILEERISYLYENPDFVNAAEDDLFHEMLDYHHESIKRNEINLRNVGKVPDFIEEEIMPNELEVINEISIDSEDFEI